ncbi:hypothetical protein NUW54_g12381 [Trametes sanguinea]|uniref:Uncharacterized protein n=1 Tax=Trametes sanguinea TaxID=158606 RepID=A0ACC1N0E4_9APHY|nr:hypothetical protein NUW54_g12381 [Trametes sanguinea]
MAPQSSSSPAASASPTTMTSSGTHSPTPARRATPVLSAVPSNFSDGNSQDAHAAAQRTAGIPVTARIDFFWEDGVRELDTEALHYDSLEADTV